MNIVWGIETSVNGSGSRNSVQVEPQDVWENVKLSKPSACFKSLGQKVNIYHKGIVFKNIPTTWYLIEN